MSSMCDMCVNSYYLIRMTSHNLYT